MKRPAQPPRALRGTRASVGGGGEGRAGRRLKGDGAGRAAVRPEPGGTERRNRAAGGRAASRGKRGPKEAAAAGAPRGLEPRRALGSAGRSAAFDLCSRTAPHRFGPGRSLYRPTPGTAPRGARSSERGSGATPTAAGLRGQRS